MKTFQWPLRAFLFVGLLQIISCTKSIDTATNDSVNLESSSNATLASEFSTCKLRYITHPDDIDGAPITGLFTYNAAGNPYSLTYLDRPGKGMPRNHYFYYDKLKRLREYRNGYSPTDPVEALWHRYGYNSNNQIIVDSLIVPGYVYEFEGKTYIIPESIWTISTLTYDVQGRIIKETINNLSSGTTRNPTYTYDNRGNLAVKDWKSSWYDTKVSYLRSHPIFQFIHRNYSTNNPWTLSSDGRKYNSKGLPLSVKPSNDAFFNSYPTNNTWGFIGGIDRLVYDCQ